MTSKLEAYLGQIQRGNNHQLKLPSIYGKLQVQKHSLNKLKDSNEHKAQQRRIDNISSVYSRKKQQAALNTIKKNRMLTEAYPKYDYEKLNKIQENIMMQIKNIDVHLESQKNQKNKFKISLFQGFIFLKQLNEMVIQKFHDCIRIQSTASNALVQGFDVPKYVLNHFGQTDIVEAKIIKKVNSINNKLLDKSINTIKDYDSKKDNQYEKNCGKQWSLFKRNNIYNEETEDYKDLQSGLIDKKRKRYNDLKKSFLINNQSRSTKLFESKLTALSNNTFLNDSSFLIKSKNSSNHSKYNAVKTQPSQARSPQIINLTKKDVKKMLNKHPNLVSMWMPPASYPQFFGLFTYKISKIQITDKRREYYRCKLTRYFFYKFSLEKKVFDAILEWINQETQMDISQLEISIEKSVYAKIFAKLGWVLKFWESHNKVKAIYQRNSTV